MSKFDDVKRFMEMAKQNVPSRPTVDGYPFDLRIRLITEEADEFAEACGYEQHGTLDGVQSRLDGHAKWEPRIIRDGSLLVEGGFLTAEPNPVEMVDALVDILYVTYGAAVAMGLTSDQFDLFWRAVHESNMAKLNGPIVNGKLMKPAGWTKPDIAGILADVLKLSATPAEPPPEGDLCQCSAYVTSYRRTCFNKGRSVLLTNERERQWLYLCAHHTAVAKKEGVRLVADGGTWKVDRLYGTPSELLTATTTVCTCCDRANEYNHGEATFVCSKACACHN